MSAVSPRPTEPSVANRRASNRMLSSLAIAWLVGTLSYITAMTVPSLGATL